MANYKKIREVTKIYKELPESGKSFITGVMQGIQIERDRISKNVEEEKKTSAKTKKEHKKPPMRAVKKHLSCNE